MQYQISYFSPNGHAETLVNVFCEMLPHDTLVTNLEDEAVPYADIQLVGFDMVGAKLDAIPIKVLEYLDGLDEKTIFLFATVPFQPNDMLRSRICNSVTPFLPDECDYRGMYLCAAQPSDELIRDLRNVAAQQPENARAKHWLERCENAIGHPDKADIQKGCQFARHVLELDV